MIEILRLFAPYLLAGAVGAVGAWQMQALRVTAVKQEFAAYKLEQKRLAQEAADNAEKRREETIKDWSAKYAKLKKDGDVYRRCVAAGKCGGCRLPDMPGIKLQATSGIDATGTNAVPATAGNAPEVVQDCAVTTLMLNKLQEDIERQGKP